MNLQKWETTIQTMTEAFNLETKESGKNVVLKEWRKSLANEPHLLKPFQIDEIVREVRKRIMSPSTSPTGTARDNQSSDFSGHHVIEKF